MTGHHAPYYCRAEFWRPTGLGNRLFSWARAMIFSQETGCTMLAPEWAHFRGGSIIRGGIDYANAFRKILLIDNFNHAPGDISGIKKRLVESRSKKISVQTLPQAFEADLGKNSLVCFDGRAVHNFADLLPYRERILSGLRTIARERWVRNADAVPAPFIGVNVRLGNDFKKVTDNSSFINKPGYLQTPLNWYIESLREIRKRLETDIPAIIISDGSASDLSTLLDEPNTVLGSSRSAIGDLLILSRAKMLLGAGRSSFSAWASFLGKIPTITIPGLDLQAFHISDDPEKHFVGEFDPQNPSEAFFHCAGIKYVNK